MNSYRLKPEAVPFFKEGMKTAIADWDTWTKTYNVDPKALEEVKPCFLEYGHKYIIKTEEGEDLKTGSLGGWDEKGMRFCFTLHFPSAKFFEYDKFAKGDILRKLMDDIQRNADRWYEKYSTEEGGQPC